MNSARLLALLTIAALGSLSQPSPAHAADEETQFWLTASAKVPLSDELSATAMVSQRFRDTERGGDYHLARGQLDYEITKSLSVGGGLTWIESATGHEWRTHQQFVLSFQPVTLRTQIEERFAPDTDRAQIRLRERIQGGIGLDAKDKLLLSEEVLYVAQSDQRTTGAHLDSLRTAASIQRHLNDSLDGSASYMLIWVPRSGAVDRLVHAPQLSIAYKF